MKENRDDETRRVVGREGWVLRRRPALRWFAAAVASAIADDSARTAGWHDWRPFAQAPFAALTASVGLSAAVSELIVGELECCASAPGSTASSHQMWQAGVPCPLSGRQRCSGASARQPLRQRLHLAAPAAASASEAAPSPLDRVDVAWHPHAGRPCPHATTSSLPPAGSSPSPALLHRMAARSTGATFASPDPRAIKVVLSTFKARTCVSAATCALRLSLPRRQRRLSGHSTCDVCLFPHPPAPPPAQRPVPSGDRRACTPSLLGPAAPEIARATPDVGAFRTRA